MIGHGRPKASGCVAAPLCRPMCHCALIAKVLLALLGVASSAAPRAAVADELNTLRRPGGFRSASETESQKAELLAGQRDARALRIRVSWGGGAPRVWRGSVTVSEGTVAEIRPLGLEADEPGSMWGEGPRLWIHERSERTFDAVDFTVSAPPEARLSIELQATDERQPQEPLVIPLAAVSETPQARDLDAHGNRMMVHRAAGDALRVRIDRAHLVFAPGETLRLQVDPNHLSLPGGAKGRLRAQLLAARSDRELWATQQVFDVDGPPLALEVPLQQNEGAYDVVLAVSAASSWSTSTWQQAVRQPLSWSKPVAERRVQVLVLDPKGPSAGHQSARDLVQVLQIDPVNPRWWELSDRVSQLPKIARRWKAPLSSGHAQVWRHSLGDCIRLLPSAEGSWEAYTLPLDAPGRPHILEVEYPSDTPQTLGISIVEPDAAGAVMPIGVDSGVDVGGDPFAAAGARWLKHRLIFWPRTTSPVVLLTNRRANAPAVYGKIRLYAGWDRLPPSSAAVDARQGQRLIAAYFDRPLFCDAFGASESLDDWSGRSLEDWVTFLEGGTRLTQYLQHVGYNGAIVSAMAEGSSLYPADTCQATPRFDRGALFGSGQDPLRKDAMEMLFRLFDREQLQLVPAIDFSAPLPELEAVLRQGGAAAEGLQWVGPEGKTLQQVSPPRQGAAPYYNLLAPRVQEAMLRVALELAGRYADHRSFAGVAVQLSADGFAQLPAPEWGLDDATAARFEKDTGMSMPGAGAARFAARGDFVAGPGRTAWLAWRARQVAQFYQRMSAALVGLRGDAQLYLATGSMFVGEAWDMQWRPALTRHTTLAEAMLRAGFDPALFQDQPGIVLLRGERIVPASASGAWAVSRELAQSPDFDRRFQGNAAAGCLFFHPPQELRLRSFDGKSPFRPAYTLLMAEVVPSQEQNRRRFVHAIATLDSRVLVDGGWLLPMGQEASLYGLMAAFRRLPAAPFTTLAAAAGSSAQPVIVRQCTHAGRSYVYLANDSPLKVSVRLPLSKQPAGRVEELSGMRPIAQPQAEGAGATWTAELEPFDLLAVRFAEPDVAIEDPQVLLPGTIETVLEERIRDLGGRTAGLRAPPALQVPVNAGFEQTAESPIGLAGWAAVAQSGSAVSGENDGAHGGQRSARMISEGPVTCLVSTPFPAPTSGRLSMSVWLRGNPAASCQPPLRLALEGRYAGQSYYRYAEVGAASRPMPAAPAPARVGPEWARYVFPVDDLPLSGLSELRVRFDLMGPGEVWIDDIELFDLLFSEKERRELAKLITVAEFQLRQRQVGDCIRLLEGYWPQFLEQNVPLEAAGVLPVAAQPQGEPQPGSAASKGMMGRVRSLIPEHLRF